MRSFGIYTYTKITLHLVPGSKVLVRCVKQLKPFIKKSIANDEEGEEEDEDEEDYSGVGGTAPPVGRIMERDQISQAYDISRFGHCFPSVRKLKTETKDSLRFSTAPRNEI